MSKSFHWTAMMFMVLSMAGCASADHQSSPKAVATAYMRDVLHDKARSAIELTHGYAMATPKGQAELRHDADRREKRVAHKVAHDLSKDGGITKTTVDKVEKMGKNTAVTISITTGNGKVSKVVVFTSRHHGKWYCDYIL
ncbi:MULTISPECIES: nuclear transport factor 2 family protein [Acidithiobacillus]|uniref:DUF4878 domain-containing protein n=1 Tax=Acidithiobacillus ferrivorans TaxID=160808 RepID=UPI001C068850|nr:DUF4878 domain-containing protein [Acidithiobacillus ferrivorans]MBU2852082.1 DUF4878 domain-containing protein [Acidithiobacillus ferrivorans]